VCEHTQSRRDAILENMTEVTFPQRLVNKHECMRPRHMWRNLIGQANILGGLGEGRGGVGWGGVGAGGAGRCVVDLGIMKCEWTTQG